MSEQKHIIKRQIIELRVQGTQEVHQLQAEVSRVYRQRIVPLIDRYCTELSETDRIHRIESLEVDLGYIDPLNLEKDFVAKLSPALHQALTEQIGQQERKAEHQDQGPKAMSQLELFALFARTGSLPWWADASQPQLLDDSLQHLVQAAPDPLRRLMRELAQKQEPLQRVVYHYADELLSSLSGLLAPTLQRTRSHDPQELIEVLQKTRAATGTQPAQLRHNTWITILHVAGLQGEQIGRPGSFYRAVLIRVAAELRSSYRDLLSDIYQVLQAGKANIRGELKNTLETLYQERLGAETEVMAQRPAQTGENTLSNLFAALRSLTPRLPVSIREEWLAAFRELKSDGANRETIPPEIVQRLLRPLRSEPVSQTLPSTVDRDWLSELREMATTADLYPKEVTELIQLLSTVLNEPVISPTTVDEMPEVRVQASEGSLTDLLTALRALAPRLPVSIRGEWLAAFRDLESDEATRETIPPDTIKRLLRLLRSAPVSQTLPSTVNRDWLSELRELTTTADLSPKEVTELIQLLSAALNEPVISPTAVDEKPEVRVQASEGSLTDLLAALRALAPRLPISIREEWLATLREMESGEATPETVLSDMPQRLLRLLRPELVLRSSPSPTGSRDWLPQLRKLATTAGMPPREIAALTRLLDMALTEEPASLTTAAEKTVDLGFSDADELYIGNAGLVILWPFLSHFFNRLDLLAEQQFKDAAATRRAVGLLQHIATEADTFPEYLLPLNKVLCGLELTQVFDFGSPLSGAEAEECADLLRAVIEQASILRTMSVPGFRGTFLLRRGVLSSRDGAWLLRVERETYDMVLDRFPWSWEWVKLPWMQAPLRVEW